MYQAKVVVQSGAAGAPANLGSGAVISNLSFFKLSNGAVQGNCSASIVSTNPGIVAMNYDPLANGEAAGYVTITPGSSPSAGLIAGDLNVPFVFTVNEVNAAEINGLPVTPVRNQAGNYALPAVEGAGDNPDAAGANYEGAEALAAIAALNSLLDLLAGLTFTVTATGGATPAETTPAGNFVLTFNYYFQPVQEGAIPWGFLNGVAGGIGQCSGFDLEYQAANSGNPNGYWISDASNPYFWFSPTLLGTYQPLADCGATGEVTVAVNASALAALAATGGGGLSQQQVRDALDLSATDGGESIDAQLAAINVGAPASGDTPATGLYSDVAGIPAAMWSNGQRTLTGTGGAIGPTAGNNNAPIPFRLLPHQSPLLSAQVCNNGRYATIEGTASISYTIWDCEEREPVPGHTAVALTPSAVLFDTLQTDAAASNYNFRWQPNLTLGDAFAHEGRYVITITFTPASGLPFWANFEGRAEW